MDRHTAGIVGRGATALVQPQPFASARADPVFNDVERRFAPRAVIVGLAVALQVVRMYLRVPAFHPVLTEARIDADPLAPVVKPDALATAIAVPQAAVRATDHGAQARVIGAQCLTVAVALNDKGGQRSG